MQNTVRLFFLFILIVSGMFLLPQCGESDKGPRVLIFNKSEFYVHECMPAAVAALEKICTDNNWTAEVSDDAELFTEKNLSRYAAVVFLNTAGDVLNPTQEIEFTRYIQAGGGFVGIHTALDTEHSWDWYSQLVGGRFDGMSEVQNATLLIQNNEHPATRHLDASWQQRDEWFNVKDLRPDVQVLLRVDETTYQGGTMGNYHPVAWYHNFDGGRAFFTALGHTKEAYDDANFLQHLQGALQYAVGDNKPLQFKAYKAPEKPAAKTGFVKTSLVCNLYEPMEMEQLPDGRILFIERRGAIKIYDPIADKLDVVTELSVYQQNEEGLLGLAIDPAWNDNHWIYLYYAPEDGESAIRLSRFVFDGKTLDKASEHILLRIPTDRTVHNYHAGGCLEFDAKGHLYLATGDNTDHYDDGYTSIDERPDKSQYDSQKSASNSMDLRGKILRIKPLPDGSYLCPAGNLYTSLDVVVAPGTQDRFIDPVWSDLMNPVVSGPTAGTAYRPRLYGTGRPEIFVMGCRNPFRFDFDDRRELLIWGEPGPDAGLPDSLRGPEGYDEINIARTAGFYGWPYFVADNRPYRDFNFETDQAGAWFDPQRPYNDSPHNTGENFLPPARPAFIWYPFKSTALFPLVANGTRCAMAGPTYYCDQYPEATRFPDRFNGKVILYEWMRNWMAVADIDSMDQYRGMELLAPAIRVARPMDMLIDKNGSLWVLEYGTEWYAQNPDACLSRIDYIRGDGTEEVLVEAGNQTPSVQWDFGGKNRSFYQPGEVVQYRIQVSDPEDGSLADGRIQPADVFVHIDFVDAGIDPGQYAKNLKPKPMPFERGKKLVEESDCKACHAVNRKINGPAYQDIASRYHGDKSALTNLVGKVIKGGSGIWGQTAMSAHPQLSSGDVTEMVRWILALKDFEPPQMQGAYTLSPPPEKGDKGGVFLFHARYNDLGAPDQPAQTGSQTIVLRPAQQQAEQADSLSKSARRYKRPLNAATTTLVELKDKDCVVYRNIDLRNIRSVSLAVDVSAEQKQIGGGTLELRLGGPDGRLVGKTAVPAAASSGGLSEAVLTIDQAALPADGALHDLFFIVKNESAGIKPVLGVDWLRFNFSS